MKPSHGEMSCLAIFVKLFLIVAINVKQSSQITCAFALLRTMLNPISLNFTNFKVVFIFLRASYKVFKAWFGRWMNKIWDENQLKEKVDMRCQTKSKVSYFVHGYYRVLHNRLQEKNSIIPDKKLDHSPKSGKLSNKSLDLWDFKLNFLIYVQLVFLIIYNSFPPRHFLSKWGACISHSYYEYMIQAWALQSLY